VLPGAEQEWQHTDVVALRRAHRARGVTANEKHQRLAVHRARIGAPAAGKAFGLAIMHLSREKHTNAYLVR